MNNTIVTADFSTKHNIHRLGDNLFEVALDTDLLVRLQVTIQGKWVATGMSWDLISQGPKVVADKATKELTVPISNTVMLIVPTDGPDRQTTYQCRIQDKSGKTYPTAEGRTFIVAMKEAYTVWQTSNL